MTWTVELRSDVRWHDGVPVPSADVAFTVALSKHPDVLFHGAGSVDSIEIIDSLGSSARAKLDAHGIENVDLYTGDASHGWERAAPYDIIAVTGSLPVPEDSFQNSLAVGGRLFVVVGREPAMRALLITRSSESQWASECLFETVLPPLAGVEEPERFVL